MKVTLKNLGLLKQAEFTLGDLTIICGGNNMGKTYATYALFGFLYFWQDLVDLHTDNIKIDFDINDTKIDELISNGVITINSKQIPIDRFELIVDRTCGEYSNRLLGEVFGSFNDQFRGSEFQINLDSNKDSIRIKANHSNLNYSIDNKEGEVLRIELLRQDDSSITLILKLENSKVKVGIKDFKPTIKILVVSAIRRSILSELFPQPFIISSERTGAATFRKELDFARNRLLKTIAHGSRDENTITSLLRQGYQDYPLPVEQNVEFTRNLERIVKKRSFIADQYPEILDEFVDMIGGDYQVTGEDIVSYIPHKNKKLKLSLTESSSAIRSLLDLGFYLRHQAAVGDLLMIDEPELNLHPDNQRRIARLLARLVNLGIKVFITTHSSYIIKELNTLIMLNRDEPHLKQIAAEENYLESELLSPDKVKVYVAKEALVQLDGQKKKTRSPTLVPAKISPELGIELTSFDTAIDTINRIQERIVWGSD
jgi:AAA ATPase domain